MTKNTLTGIQLQEYLAVMAKIEAEEAAKASGKAKLVELGLTLEEISALLKN
jgi:hypothetical protein